jgi:hypothetical protein
VLAEFGLSLPAEIEVRVHDSTADPRYLVLPQRPPALRAGARPSSLQSLPATP